MRQRLIDASIIVGVFLGGIIGSWILMLMFGNGERAPAGASSYSVEATETSNRSTSNSKIESEAKTEASELDLGVGDASRLKQAKPIEPPKVEERFNLNSELPKASSDLAKGSIENFDEAQLELDSADSRMIDGDFKVAISKYEALIEKSPLDSSKLLLRIATCQEVLGKLDYAEKNYQLVIERSPDQSLRALAHLGVCRIWLESGKSDLAKYRLWKLFLSRAANRWESEGLVQAEISHLLSASLIHDLYGKLGLPNVILPEAKYQIEGIAKPTAILIRKISSSNKSTDIGSGPQTAFQVNHRLDVATIVGIGIEKLALIRQVANTSQLDLTISDAARMKLKSKTIDLNYRNKKLSLLLDGILTPMGCVWSLNPETNVFSVSMDDGTDTTFSYPTEITKRMSRFAILNHPVHRLSLQTKMGLANLDYLTGGSPAAKSQYQQLTQEPSNRMHLPTIRFNLGMCALDAREYESAEASFQAVIDNNLDGEALHRAYYELGKLRLQKGDFDETEYRRAVKDFSRGIIVAKDPKLKAKMCLGQLAGYALDNRFYDVLYTMNENSRLLAESESTIPQAKFFAAYSRFHVVENRLKVELAESLLNATQSVDPSSFTGLTGYILLSRAYRSLKFDFRAKQIIADAVKATKGTRHFDRFAMQYIEMLKKDNELQPALALLEEMAKLRKGKKDELTIIVHKDLAETLSKLRQNERALEANREAILADEQKLHLKENLMIRGKILQDLGQHYSAAQCFAGVVPDIKPAEKKNE